MSERESERERRRRREREKLSLLHFYSTSSDSLSPLHSPSNYDPPPVPARRRGLAASFLAGREWKSSSGERERERERLADERSSIAFFFFTRHCLASFLCALLRPSRRAFEPFRAWQRYGSSRQYSNKLKTKTKNSSPTPPPPRLLLLPLQLQRAASSAAPKKRSTRPRCWRSKASSICLLCATEPQKTAGRLS